MMTELLLILVPMAIMVASIFVFAKGYKHAKENDHGYTIASALENPIPVETEANQLLMEYAEAMNGRYSDFHKANHSLKWVEKLDDHVKRNKGYYQTKIKRDKPIEQLSKLNTNVVSIRSKNH